jgi:hypothetical protein
LAVLLALNNQRNRGCREATDEHGSTEKLLRRVAASATLPVVSESAYKPTEAYEDELDQLARSIRGELQSAGFRPAFDPEPEEVARARRAELERRRRRIRTRRLLLGYIIPLLAILAISIALRLFAPAA